MRVSVPHWILFASLALPLGGCGTRDPYVATRPSVVSGSWEIERQVDRITGTPVSSATLITQNSSSTTVAFPQPATLQLMCFKEQPVVRIAFQFKVGSTLNASLGYRFDDKPGHETDARFVQDYRTVVIEDRDEVAKFVRELAISNALYLRIRALNAPRSSAEFKVDGAPAAIEAAFASCPIAPPRPQKADPPPARRRAR